MPMTAGDFPNTTKHVQKPPAGWQPVVRKRRSRRCNTRNIFRLICVHFMLHFFLDGCLVPKELSKKARIFGLGRNVPEGVPAFALTHSNNSSSLDADNLP